MNDVRHKKVRTCALHWTGTRICLVQVAASSFTMTHLPPAVRSRILSRHRREAAYSYGWLFCFKTSLPCDANMDDETGVEFSRGPCIGTTQLTVTA